MQERVSYSRKRFRRGLGLALSLLTIAVLADAVGDLFTVHPELPLLRRNAAAWLLYWPRLIWDPSPDTKVGNFDAIACFVIGLAVYTLSAFGASCLWDWRRSK